MKTKRHPTFLPLIGVLFSVCVHGNSQSPEGWLRDSPAPASSQIQNTLIAAGIGNTQDEEKEIAREVAPRSPVQPMAAAGAMALTAADAVTPEIEALTRGVLQQQDGSTNWEKIFRFVSREFKYEHYYGSKKGGTLTLAERSGNDADLCTLLAAMLKSAGYQVRYRYGLRGYRYANDPTGVYVQDWLGVTGADINALVNNIALLNLLRGFPANYLGTEGSNTIFFHRVWLQVLDAGVWRAVDPAVKRVVRTVPNASLDASTGYDRNSLRASAAPVIGGNYVENVNEAGLFGYLTSRATQLLGSIDAIHHGAEAVALYGGWSHQQYVDGGGNPLRSFGVGPAGDTPEIWDTLPASIQTQLKIEVRSSASGEPLVAEVPMAMPSLMGGKLSVDFTTDDNSGKTLIKFDDTVIGQELSDAVGSSVKIKIIIDHPHSNVLSSTLHDQYSEKTYKRGARYAIPYSFNASEDLIRLRSERLDKYRRDGYADTSSEVVTETLNLIGLNWLRQTQLFENFIGGKTNCDPFNHHKMGRVGQESGYYIDLSLIYTGVQSRDFDNALEDRVFAAGLFTASSMEHGVIEQLQGSSNPGASTVKMLRLGNQQAAGSGKTFYANSGNWASIQTQLQGYSSGDLAKVQAAIDAGGTALLPQKGNMTLNEWTGTGFTTITSTSLPGGGVARAYTMHISGDLLGGYGSKKKQVSPPVASALSNSDPYRNQRGQAGVQSPKSPEPVDMLTGDYYLKVTDLDMEAGAPRGLSFSRFYHGARRQTNPTGLGFGWTHNWHMQATRRSAYEQALGSRGTPQDIAVAYVATQALLDLASMPTDAESQTLMAFVAHWLTDQIQDNAVSVSVGERAFQFTRRPDGSWQSPGGVTATLEADGAGWLLRERHGNRYKFDASGRLTQILDQWSLPLNVTYNAAGLVDQVTDSNGRSLGFGYTNGLLTTVNESTGRGLVLSHDVHGNLATVTDPEAIIDRYVGDAEHQIIEVRNHENQVLVRNFFDPLGRVMEQHALGDPARSWGYFYSLSQTVEVDPKGGKNTIYFDSKNRQYARHDPMGRISKQSFDGQDRVFRTESPGGYVEQWVYDRYHNPTAYTDGGGSSFTYQHDSEQRLYLTTDELGNELMRVVGFTPQHQPLVVKNGEGETTTNTYDPATGNLMSRAPPGLPAVSFQYNSRQELWKVTFPGGAYEQYDRNLIGDVLQFRDAQGNLTDTEYNKRRQVTKITRRGAPNDLVTANQYDSARNLWKKTDGRGLVTEQLYNLTGKPTVTRFEGGAEIVNTYDVCDWLESTENELGDITTFTRNAAGQVIERFDPAEPAARKSTFSHDAEGREFRVTDSLNKSVQTDFDGRGNAQLITDQLGKSSENLFDLAGRRNGFKNRRGHTYQFDLDGAGRLKDTVSPEQRHYRQSWNAKGLVGTVTEPSGETTTFTHDNLGRVVTRADAVGTTATTLDDVGNPLFVVENSITIEREFDAFRRPTKYNDGHGNEIGYTWDKNSNLERLRYEVGKEVVYHLDDRNRPDLVTDWTGRQTQIGYDDAGHMTLLIRHNGTRRELKWNKSGQLKDIKDRHTASLNLIVSMNMSFDTVGSPGRMLLLPKVPNPVLPTAPNFGPADKDNRITTVNGQAVVHNTDGSMTFGPSAAGVGPFVNYGWNARNQLTSTPGGGICSYDSEGVRTTLSEGGQTTTFVTDPHGGPLPRILKRVVNGQATYHIYVGLLLLYEIRPDGTARYYHYDHVGNCVALTDDAGQVVGRAAYSSYGVTVATSGNMDTPFRWQGAFGIPTDASGLVQMRARFYHPWLGRFISEDPLGLAAGPNVYAYADGNPILLNDPSGMWLETAWDVANVVWGVGSLVNNVRQGNYGAAALDLAGIVVDTAAVVAPVPGGAGAALRFARAGDDVVDTAKGVAATTRRIGGESAAAADGRRAHQNYGTALGEEYDTKYTLPSGKKPDAVNWDKGEVRELKPDNSKAIRRGELQVENYRKELEEVTGRKFTTAVDTYQPKPRIRK